MSPRYRMLPLLVFAWLPAPLAGQPLPPGAYAQFGSHRYYHGPGIVEAVLSPDGSRIASIARYKYSSHVSDAVRHAYEETIVLWNTATGERVRECRGSKPPIGDLAFSSDGNLLAATDDSGIVVFDVARGELVRQFENNHFPRQLRFSCDYRRLFFVEGREAAVSIDAVTGKELKRSPHPASPSDWIKANEYVCEGIISHDGKYIAWLLDVSPDYSKLPPDANPAPHVPRPTAVLVTEFGSENPSYRKTFAQRDLDTFVFSQDGQKFFAGRDKVAVYETVTGKLQLTLNVGSPDRPTPSPDGKRAVVVTGWTDAGIWNLDTGTPRVKLSLGLLGMYSGKWAFSGDGKTLLLATDSTLRVFDAESGKERTVVGHRSPVQPRFSADGRTLFTRCAEATCQWDLARPPKDALVTRRSRNSWEILAHDYSADEQFFLECRKDKVRVRETASGRVRSTMEGAHDANLGLLSQDCSRVMLWNWSEYTRDGEGVRLYDAATGKKSGEFKPPGVAGYHPVFSPNAQLIAWASTTNDVILYDSITGKMVRTLRSARPLPKAECDDASLLFSPDGAFLIVTTYYQELFGKRDDIEKWHTFPTRVFDVASGKETHRFYGNPEKTSKSERFSCVACSPDNRILAVAEKESGSIRLIEIASGKVRTQLDGHRHGVQGLAFSPDGKTLASGGADNIVFLWDLVGAKSIPSLIRSP